MTLDPGTSFWVSQNSSDAGANLHDLGDVVSEHGMTDRGRREEERESDVVQAYREAQGRAEERESFDRSRPHREELESRYGASGAKVSDLIESFVKWDGEFKNSPLDAADRLAQHYLQQPPGALRTREPTKAETAPADWREDGKREWEMVDAAKRAYRDAVKEKNEATEFDKLAEHRTLLKQQFPNLSFEAALERITGLDRDLLTDPVGTAGKLAASYGAPVTHNQVQAAEQQVHQQQRLETAVQAIDWAQATLPNYDRLEGVIADVLHHPEFQHTGHKQADLSLAHAIAQGWVANGYQSSTAPAAAPAAPVDPGHDAVLRVEYPDGQSGDHQRALDRFDAAEGKLRALGAAEKARRASRSVSGSMSPGNSSGSRRDTSVEDDAMAAYRSLGGAV